MQHEGILEFLKLSPRPEVVPATVRQDTLVFDG